MPDDMYERIMKRLEGRGVMTVVDATKDLLVKVLKYHPFLVKPNNHELGEIFGVELKTREDVVPYGKKLQEMGAENVLISMAGEGAVLIAANGQVYKKPVPTGTLVNGVGAGDSMVAGFMAGWMEKEITAMLLHGNRSRQRQCLFRKSGHRQRGRSGLPSGSRTKQEGENI